jgi:ATP-binding cassette subfamily B multidrug efflux pump
VTAQGVALQNGPATLTTMQAGGGALRSLLPLTRPYRGLLLGAVICVLSGAFLELLPPLVVKQVIDGNLANGERDGLLQLGLVYFAATAALQGTTFLTSYLTALAAQGVLHDLRVKLYDHLQRLPLSYYDRTPIGDAISRCTADIETINVLFTSGVATLAAELVRLVTIAATMLALSVPLSAVAGLTLPILLGVTRFFQVHVRVAERATRLAVGRLNTDLQESLVGVEVVRAFGREAHFVQRFRRTLKSTLAASNVSFGYSAVYPCLTSALTGAATAWLLWAGTGGVFADWGVSIGTLTAFVLLLQRFFRPISALGEQWQQVQSAVTGAERVFSVLDLAPEDAPHAPFVTSSLSARNGSATGATTVTAVGGPGPGAFEPADAHPTVELRDVVFGYLPDRPVLRRVSFSVRAGEHVALVGRTGAGKTSALHLLAGLYETWSGEVRVAGIDPRLIPEDDRRRVIGVVPQAVHLFSGTVYENLTLYDSSVPRESVRRAAELTSSASFIEALPNGYDTVLSGSRGDGTQLSAGQRQLMALTRALIWEPRVLLLDEATAAIDGASDAAFRAALRRAMRERGDAVLTVAHRLSTAREADRVLVLDAGVIVEEGPPSDLVTRGGRFATLVALEEAGLDWERLAGPIAAGG